MRGVELGERLEKPKALLLAQLAEGGCLTRDHAAALFLGRDGFVARLADLAEDVPKAPLLTGRVLGDFAAAGHVALGPVLEALQERPDAEAGEGGDDEQPEDPPLVDAEHALPLAAALLNRWREAAGDEGAAAKAAWAAAGGDWARLLPGFARSEADVAKALDKHGAAWVASA